MTRYTLTVSREIEQCDPLIIGTKVTAIAAKVPDPEQHYLLDSSGIWSTSDIQTTFDTDGSSKGLNAGSQDQTGQVISEAVQVGASIALGAAALVTPACNDPVKNALKALHPEKAESLQKQVKNETTDLANITAQVTLLTQQASKSPAYLNKLVVALGKQAAAQKRLTTDQAKLTTNQAIVTEVQVVQWPGRGSEVQSQQPLPILPATLQKWGMPTVSPSTNVWFALYCQQTDGSWRIPGSDGATAACGVTRAASTAGASDAKVTAIIGDPNVGVPVRTPRLGKLMVCQSKKDDNKTNPCGNLLKASDDSVSVTAAATPQLILQIGQMYNIRAAGGTFKSETATIALDGNGTPQTLEVAEKQAAAVAATGAAASGAQAIAAIPTSIAAVKTAQAQELSAEITAKTAQANYNAALPTLAQTDQLQAQASLAVAKNSVSAALAGAQYAGPNAALAAQQTMLNLQNQIDSLNSILPNAPQEDALTAQTTLDQAIAAQINAATAAAQAQAVIPAKTP